MGQQQILIIVLCVFIAGMTIYGTLNLMDTYNQSHQRDLIIQRMNVLVGEAKRYATKTVALGGGGGSFLGFTPPVKLATTPEMRIFSTAGGSWVLFQGFGTKTGQDGKTPVQVIAQYDRANDRWATLAIVN